MSRDEPAFRVLVILAGLLGVVLLVVGAVHQRHDRASAIPTDPHAAPPTPSVYCDFYDFTRARVVVSFDFAVDGMPATPRFAENATVEPDGTRTTFEEADRPAWSYTVEDDTPQIAAPDGETRIVLYGLQPKKGGVFWTEAGLRSNRFRNLEGKCRQAYLSEKANSMKGAPR